MILRILNRKIVADFLPAAKAYINLELAKTPVTITYENWTATFRNQANHKFPPDLSSSNNIRTRGINKSGTHGGGRGRIFQGR